MNGRRGILIVSAVMLGGVFVAGTLWLAILGIQGGKVYPAYSSLRSDPNGTRALAEALERTGVQVGRHYEPLTDELPTEGTTLVYAGGPGQLIESLAILDPNEILKRRDALGRFVREGGRLLVALDTRSPVEIYGIDTRGSDEPIVSRNELPTRGLEWLPGDPPAARYRNRVEFWYHHRQQSPTEPAFSHPGQGHYVFDPNGRWQAISGRPNEAYAVRRPLGKGQIVLVGSSHFLTNRALADRPDVGQIAELLGAPRRVVFDEYHLGLTDRRGIASMAREYGLAGTMGVLGVLAGLFIWRSATRI
ncbi:MAG: DUF4350 domain-containing protein, partial [Phycisphaerae bacterium]